MSQLTYDWLVSQDQGKLSEAEPLMRRSLAIKEKALGPDHPDVAISLSSIASLLQVCAISLSFLIVMCLLL